MTATGLATLLLLCPDCCDSGVEPYFSTAMGWSRIE